MKRLISIVLVMLIASMFSGCVIVDAHYSNRHRYQGGFYVTNYPPPPPPQPVYIYKTPPPPPPPVVIVKPAPAPHHNGGPGPGPGGRRDLRR